MSPETQVAAHQQRIRSSKAARLIQLSAALALSGTSFSMTNTQLSVPDGTSDLTTLGATSTSDLTFLTSTYTGTTFAISGATTLTTGTINVLNTTQTLTRANATAATTSTLVLSGGSNSVAPNAADLLYVAPAGTLVLPPDDHG